MAQNKYIAAIQIADKALAATLKEEEAILLASLAEGGHTISNDLAEMIQGGKKDYGRNSVEEEIKLTVDRVPGDKGQEALKEAVKNFKQLRIWIWEVKKREGFHHGTFAYVIVEEHEWSFDDEDDKIEITAKVKFNSADGKVAELPPEWLNPSAQAPTVEWEDMGAYTDTYENRTPKSGA
ncbi:TP901-1 family phage major tail protein [Staphylococcus pasteuri]|uniref:Phage major tail protein, TP901-1 family n=1 Tax=Staphylococcus pasteuri TaxID=45972 RepID=A0ABY1H703_9STAP|nr:tail protein [Staphylococcus pasteuri]KKI54732.1 Phage protein [Staphylococcus pasteuri]SFZ78609.1 phage major tail protein, TP901-1 family [Staphylococcus pasteuri]